MKIALDTNVLLYLAAVWRSEGDKAKTAIIRPIIERLADSASLTSPSQTFGEAYSAMQRIGHPRENCRHTIIEWRDRFEAVAGDDQCFLNALDLATDHKLQFWDALILATASQAGCVLLLSEDMQDGFEWQGTTVANPFAPLLNQKLARVLA